MKTQLRRSIGHLGSIFIRDKLFSKYASNETSGTTETTSNEVVFLFPYNPN